MRGGGTDAGLGEADRATRAGALRRREVRPIRAPSCGVFCRQSFQQGEEEDRHSGQESDRIGQQDTDDREQRAGQQENGLPANPYDPRESHDGDDRE